MSDIKAELLQNETVRRQIAERAYFLAKNHHFAQGREMEFWLAAEDEVISGVMHATDVAATVAPIKPAHKTAVKKAVVAQVAPELLAEAPGKAAPRKRTVKKADA